MTVVLLNSPIEAEINVSAREIGFIRAGDRTTIKVDAFPFIEHGMAHGRLTWVSEGTFTLDEDGKPVDPYYKARVAIEDMHFHRVPSSFRLIPA